MAQGKTRSSKKSAVLNQMKELELKLQALKDQERISIGKLAEKAGCLDLDIPDEDYLSAFKELARRFQESGTKQSPTGASPSPTADQPNAAE